MAQVFWKARGGLLTDPWINLDGRLNAPSGSPQFASLLSPYPTATAPNPRTRWPNNGSQPPWRVAGVDYPAGINSGTSLVVPTSGNVPSGVSVGSNSISINTDNVVFNGFDCTGFQIQPNAANILITNCLFAIPSSGGRSTTNVLSGATNCVFRYCEFNGNNFNDDLTGVLMLIQTAGECTVEYCYLHDEYGDSFDL